MKFPKVSDLKRQGVFLVMQLAGNSENLISEFQLLAETGWNGGLRGWREGKGAFYPKFTFSHSKI